MVVQAYFSDCNHPTATSMVAVKLTSYIDVWFFAISEMITRKT